MTKIVLIDDHNLFRAGIKALLIDEPELSVVAEAATAEEGLHAVQSHACDLVVLDYNLPDQDAPSLIARIRRFFPKLPILLLSQHTDFDRVREVMDCGCHGYMVKSADEHDLITALRLVATGGIYVHPTVAPALLTRGPEDDEFSSREKAVVRLVAVGCSNQEIANRLHVSLGTVKRDLSILFERTGVSDRTQLLIEAISRGLVEPSQ